jgi:hypothetical protein
VAHFFPFSDKNKKMTPLSKLYFLIVVGDLIKHEKYFKKHLHKSRSRAYLCVRFPKEVSTKEKRE